MADNKSWGKREFWGVGYDYDHRWYLTDAQKDLQNNVMELCRTTLRPNGIQSDAEYKYPRENLNAMADLGLLGLITPLELGGLGQNHQCAAMVCETIARYGCPSTAMVYVMHLGAVSALLFRYHNNNHIRDLLSRLDKDKLVGTESFSDPATGGHFWYALSSKCWQLSSGHMKILKFASWTTSAGFADWYALQTVSPGFDGDYSNLTTFLAYPDEVRGNTEDWSALGLHGNQSGPLVTEGVLKPERIIGRIGEGNLFNDECIDIFFLLLSSSVWNGIAMGSIDLAKRHVVSKTHGDVGIRVCDYPTIQDYFGESTSMTNAARCITASFALALDDVTNNCDWSIHSDVTAVPRSQYLQWGWQTKFVTAKNVTKVVDTMLHACGGSGYKTELGLERLLRDGKAGWVMGPSNEVLRGWVGKTVLLGLDVLDYWNQSSDERILRGEIRKMGKEEKRRLAERLLYEANLDEGEDTDKFDFDNPLSSKPPAVVGTLTTDQVTHEPGLSPKTFTETKLANIIYLTKDERYALFKFNLADPNMHSGCYSGQYIELAIPGSETGRFISPVSEPTNYGSVEAVIRYETQGVLAKFLNSLKIGDTVSFRGPCGGLEYVANTYTHMVFICGGIGVTPAIQMIRSIHNNPADTTRVTVFFQAKNMDELLFREELDEYARNDEKIKVVYTLQDMDDAWSGSDGYIDYSFLQQHMPAARDDGRLKVIVCGGGYMITVCLNALSLLKFRSQDIYIYGAFAAEQVRSVYGRNVKLFQQ